MADLGGFDASTVEPSVGMQLLPAGSYEALVAGSALKPTRAGTGSYLELTFRIAEGPCAGRTVKSRLNLNNPNSEAVLMARAELSAVCRAVGVLAPRDSAELHGLRLQIEVAHRRRQDTGEAANEIVAYRPAARPSPQPSPAQAPSENHAQPAAGRKRA